MFSSICFLYLFLLSVWLIVLFYQENPCSNSILDTSMASLKFPHPSPDPPSTSSQYPSLHSTSWFQWADPNVPSWHFRMKYPRGTPMPQGHFQASTPSPSSPEPIPCALPALTPRFNSQPFLASWPSSHPAAPLLSFLHTLCNDYMPPSAPDTTYKWIPGHMSGCRACPNMSIFHKENDKLVPKLKNS